MATKSIRLSDGTDTLYPESAQSGSGYQKCADGTLIQWGVTAKITMTSHQISNTTIDFPIAFNAAPRVFATAEGAFTPYTEISGPTVNTITTSSFICRFYNNYSSSINPNINWVAIGRWK